MDNEFNTALKIANTVNNLHKILLEQISKFIDILLKDRDKLSDDEVDKCNKLKDVTEKFQDYLKGGGRLEQYSISEADKSLIEQILTENDKSYEEWTKNKVNSDFEGKFAGNHFAFENVFIKLPDDTYAMYIREADLSKFKDLVDYMNENQYKNDISLVKKDISNILKIDNTKDLMSLDIKENIVYQTIANALNASHIPFEVANQESGQRIIYEKDNKNLVLDTIDNLKELSKEIRSDLILNQNKDFNNRKEAKDTVNAMIKDEPTKENNDNKER